MTIANPLLRTYVTRVGFDLSLGKTHVLNLVTIRQQELDFCFYMRSNWPGKDNFVSAASGLRDRGLVTHHPPEERPSNRPARWHWRTTSAGLLVCELLHETGLYEEYLEYLGDPIPDRFTWDGEPIEELVEAR